MTRRSTPPSPESGAAQDAAAPARGPETVTRVLAREVIHEGARRRPGETITLPAADAAVLEPEGYFEAPAH